MILYGIPTCDTCRKALAALRAAGHDATLRDVRAAPLSPAEIARFEAAFGDRLVNRASATWRALGDSDRAVPVAQLLVAHPTVMKRPVIDADGQLFIGWNDAVRSSLTI